MRINLIFALSMKHCNNFCVFSYSLEIELYRMKKNIGLFLVSFVLLFAGCSSEPEENSNNDEPIAEQTRIAIETLFDETRFPSDTVLNLLHELNICDPNQLNLNNADTPACDPKFFKLFTFEDGKSMHDSFLLLARAGTHGYGLRRLYVFQRVNDQLVQVNRFMANLIEKRKTQSGTWDLILRFTDGEQNFFNCLYSWKEGKYQFKKVEQINDSDVKAEFQDEMNIEISQLILKNGMEI